MLLTLDLDILVQPYAMNQWIRPSRLTNDELHDSSYAKNSPKSCAENSPNIYN